jgi:hypothetical protein
MKVPGRNTQIFNHVHSYILQCLFPVIAIPEMYFTEQSSIFYPVTSS